MVFRNQFNRWAGIRFLVLAICMLSFSTAHAQRGGDRGDRGGDRSNRGGDRGGGGFRGGQQGGPGGGRGFDPTFILQRMDRNGNGRLDPNEIDERAKGMLNRFAPGIDTSKPVKFDEVRKKFQEARQQRERGGGGGDRGNRTNRGGGSDQAPTEIEPLVPGFGEEVELEPVLGFGGSGAFFAVTITKSDEAEAKRTLDRYDKNKNGRLERAEIKNARWMYGDPSVYDQNGDGSLTKRELSVRYAKQRLSKDETNVADRRERGRRDRDDRDRDRRDDEDDVDEQVSYRFLSAHERLPSGTPAAFREMDSDLDGQVSMNEYAKEWNESVVSKFSALDADGNGILTATEAIQSGDFGGGAGAPDTGGKSDRGNDKAESANGPPSKADGPIPEKYRAYAVGYIKKYDLDENGSLSESEVEKMRRPPKNADVNGDGKITVEEFARSVMR